ncbi:tRNA lysidine(34) synthetase TilS [Lentibacillus halophilus]|uniref:tRNA(Ile)-lysidine synthase n=1 Tax=Lentibacillus halophilus TaxID=295065 RepID=A0ABP3J4W8_9BACI
MQATVQSFINKHALMSNGATVLAGISGGPDSMALLHFLWQLRDMWNLRVIALTADHQLRNGESRDDLRYVQRMCCDWNIEFVSTSLDVASYKQTDQLGTQAAARSLRYAFFEREMERFQADYLMLGHHGDDQAETMLMGLVHSAGVRSLAGIPVHRPFATGHIVRPLLCVTKEAIEDYCSEWGIIPRRDPSNHDDAYTRNYYRRHVLPLLKDKNSNMHRTMQHLSESLQEDNAFLMEKTRQMAEEVAIFNEEKRLVSFSIDDFLSYPRSLQRRFFHLLLNYLYNDQQVHISYNHEEQFFALLNVRTGNVTLDFPRKLKVERNYHNMVFFVMDEDSLSYQKTLDVPGEQLLPNGYCIAAHFTDCPETEGGNVYACRAANISLPLHIRTRQAGDRMSWSGLHGSKKLKDVFIDGKIPLNERNVWPIITDNNGDILWLVGLKKGLPPIKKTTGPYIQLTYGKREK